MEVVNILERSKASGKINFVKKIILIFFLRHLHVFSSGALNPNLLLAKMSKNHVYASIKTEIMGGRSNSIRPPSPMFWIHPCEWVF